MSPRQRLVRDLEDGRRYTAQVLSDLHPRSALARQLRRDLAAFDAELALARAALDPVPELVGEVARVRADRTLEEQKVVSNLILAAVRAELKAESKHLRKMDLKQMLREARVEALSSARQAS